MNILYSQVKRILFLLLTLLFTSHAVFSQVNVNISTQINGFRHNWDCNNDGINNNEPDIRYKVWMGWNGGNFAQSTNGPGLFCGAANYTYGIDSKVCSEWNPGLITGPSFSNVAATTLNVDMQSWEEDESGTPNVWPFDQCPHDNCNPNNNTWCANNDDTRCGRLRIGDIGFSTYEPCSTVVYTGQFTSGSFLSMTGRCGDNNGGGFGLDKLNVNWNFASAPTIVTQPNDASYGGSIRDVCTGLPVTLTVVCNAFGAGNWTLGRWVKWQSSTDNSNWTDISGTLNGTAYLNQTTFTYNFTPGTPGTMYYRAVLSSLCTSGFGSQTTNSASVQFVIHDASSDPFCTAPTCNVAYVDPTIASEVGATGSPSNPYKNISTAAATAPTYIRVAKCASGCTDPVMVSIPNNCVIEGGYVRSGSSGELWRKSSASADQTIITFSGDYAPNGTNRQIVAFHSASRSGWTVKDLTIYTANTPSGQYATTGRGMSNYGFLISSSSGYKIIRCNIYVGNAGAGRDGTANTNPGGGVNGSAGSTGSAGNSGQCNTSNGVANGNGGSGGNGGNGTANTSNPGSNGAQGTGGAGYGTDNGNCITYCANTNGNAGGKGGNGGNGGSWTAGNRPSAPITNAAYYAVAGAAENGGHGGGGGGGGGGSGSRGGEVACIDCDGFAGATGRAGGQGGAGGAGGFGAGGSFGIWRYNSNGGTPLIEEVDVTVGSAGTGGSGQNGRPGVTGGGATSGQCNNCVRQRCSGNGGAAGNGGAGGRGRDGANGISAEYVVDGSSSNLNFTIQYPSTITLDNYSQRSNISGKMCNNSEIDMSKTSGTWSLSSGLSYVNNLTSSTSSYNNSTNTVKVTTNNYNTFFDISNGTNLNRFLYTANENRSLPTVVKGSTYICNGSTMALSTNNNYDVGNIQEYEYVVFADGSNANSPFSGGTYNSSAANYTTPSFTTNGRYWVRYRERHNCCGWSRPVFDYFDVIDIPNTPASINIVGGPYCYNGSGHSFTITIPGSSFAFPTYDTWKLYDVDPTFGTPTPIQSSNSPTPSFGVTPSQTTTYYVRGENACGVSTALSVTAYISGDANPFGVISTATSSKTCVVNDNNWHYFRNTSNEIIAAINSNGQNLGNVTMTVTVETVPHDGSYLSPKHGNGGIGNAKVCLGQPELSMRRWYTITPQFQPTAGNPSTIRLFFTAADYLNYSTEVVSWTSYIASNYPNCYGYTNSAIDLAVSKDELADITPNSVGLTAGPNSTTQYELSVPSFSTFRFHTSGGYGEALPVELTSFTGWNEGAVNKLRWVTASEQNSDKYDIEKSTDNGQWSKIGELPAAGNSTLPITYDFTDNNPIVGDNYYRLKMWDKDATFEYSNVINIPLAEAITNGFTNIYPNPTSGDLNVELQSTQAYDTRIMVYDVLGKEIYNQASTLIKGINRFTFDFAHLPKGVYLIQFSDKEGKTHIAKFVKD